MTKKESDIINNNLLVKAAIIEIQADIAAIAQNAELYKPESFDKRIEAVDFMEFHIIDHIEAQLLKGLQTDELSLLKNQAEELKAKLEAIDIHLFQKLQSAICTGKYTGNAFKNLVNKYIDIDLSDNNHGEPDYDNLDIFINGLFPSQTIPGQTKNLEADMVYYQKTPARIIFELVEHVHFTGHDVFFDIGSGLGQVAMLVNLLTGVTVKGVEFEPAFCDYARTCAAGFNLPNVTFINVDARAADYAGGTVFFMFTPFKGEMMEAVLTRLRQQALHKEIKIITYGPCTAQVARQNWLRFTAPQTEHIYQLRVFTSL